LNRRLWVKRCNWLIGKKNFGLLHQAARNGHSLHLPTRQSICALENLRGKPDTIEMLQGLASKNFRVRANAKTRSAKLAKRTHKNILHTGHPPDESELLEDESNVSPKHT
jgi:hypothetical protein